MTIDAATATGPADVHVRTEPDHSPRRAGDVIGLVAPLIGWCGFAGYVYWQGTTGTPIIWTDTASYITVAAHPLWSTGFWAGQRPPLVPLMMKLVGTNTGFVTFQCLVAVAAWGVLAFTVGRLVAPGWRRVVSIWIVLGFATSTPIILWNRSVLSESLSMSFLALLMAAAIQAARRLSWPRVLSVVAAGLAFAATRDAQVWTVALLGIVIGLVALTTILRERRLPRKAVALAAGLVVVAALTGWVVVHTGRTRENVANVLYVRIFPFPARVAWFAQHGMPAAAAIDRSMDSTPAPSPGAAKVFWTTDPTFAPHEPTLQRWIVNHGQATYFRWLVTHPVYVITEPLVRPERSFNFDNGLLTFYASPDRVGSPVGALLWPAWWWLLPLSVIALVPAAVTGLWRDRTWRTIVLLGGLGVITMLIAWHGDGQEVTRHTVEGFAEVRASVLIVALVGVMHVVPEKRRRGAHLAGTRSRVSEIAAH
ncbi:MAG TPA: hypothetical protein VIJ09_13610 [Acidimicrobiales bacterium]